MKYITAVAIVVTAVLGCSYVGESKAETCESIAKEAIEKTDSKDFVSLPVAVHVCERWKEYAVFDKASWDEVFASELKMAKGNVKLENFIYEVATAAKN